MRVLAIKQVDATALYNRTSAARALGISESSFDRYFRKDLTCMKIGNSHVYLGKAINEQGEKLVSSDEKFVRA